MTVITWGTTPTDGDITRRVPALAGIAAGIQDDILAFVNTKLDTRLFELGEADPRLKLARIYLALHFATGDASNGVGDGSGGPSGPTTQESVGGMMRQYEALGSDGDPLLMETYWGRRYRELVRGKRFGVLVF